MFNFLALSFTFTTPPILSIGFAGQREKKERKKETQVYFMCIYNYDL
jgi:hypothetical protein